MVAGSHINVLNVEGGWSAILQVPRIRGEQEWALMLLSERDVLVQPGYFFDFESEAFLVVSLLTPPAVFEEGIRRLISGSMQKPKTIAALTAFTLFMGQLMEVSGQQKFPLTIENIMRGPGL